MAMNALEDRLPCGVELDALVAEIADDLPPADPAHQARCPYCQTALGALGQSWDALQTVAREPVAIPPGLTRGIMTRVRDLAVRATDSLILASGVGHTRIGHAVIGQIARRAALTVPGVVFASTRLEPGHADEPKHVALTLRLVIAFGPAVEDLVAAVRTSIDRRVPRLTGAEIINLDICIEDIAGPEA